MARMGLPIGLAALCVAGAATLSAQQAPCVGDCDRDGRVTINELVVAVNIALDAQEFSACPAADANASDGVEINELIAAVGGALTDCMPTPTMGRPTATRTATVSSSPTATATATATQTTAATATATGFIDLGCASVGCTVVANTLDRSVSFVAVADSTGARGGRSAGGAELPLGSVSLVGVPRSVAVAGDGLALVTTRAPDRLVVIDVLAQSVAGEVEGLGALPEAVAATPDAGLALVTNFDSRSVSIIDMPALGGLLRAQPRSSRTIAAAALVAQGTVQERTVGDNPNAVGITPDGALAYVTNYGSHSVSVIDLDQRSVRGTIEVEMNPNSVAISPDGAFAYVANFSSHSVTVIRTADDEPVFSLQLLSNFETQPTGLTLTPDGGTLYVTNFNLSSDELFGSVFAYAIDRATGLPENTPPRRLDYRDLGMADQLPSAVRATADTALVSNFVVTTELVAGKLLAQAGGGTLALIDTADVEMIDSLPVGSFPVSLDPVPTPAAPVVTATPATPPATATPTVGERCGAMTCEPPRVCLRDIGCHRNGCPPHDRCCPPDALDCRACRLGSNAGVECDDDTDCPGGSCPGTSVPTTAAAAAVSSLD